MSRLRMLAGLWFGACADEGTSPVDTVPVDDDRDLSPFLDGEVTPDHGEAPYTFSFESGLWAFWGPDDAWEMVPGNSDLAIRFTFTGKPTIGRFPIGDLKDAHRAVFTESGTFGDDEDRYFSEAGTVDITRSEVTDTGAPMYVVDGTYDIHFSDLRNEPDVVKADITGGFADVIVVAGDIPGR